MKISYKKIHTRIIAAILPVVFVSTISLMLISYFASVNRIYDEMEQKMFALLEGEAVRIQDELNKNAAIAQGLVSYVQAVPEEMLLRGDYERFMRTLIPSNPTTIGGGIWYEPYALDPAIEYFGPYYYHADGEYRMTDMYETAEYDYPTTEWYINGKNVSSGIAWTDIYYDPLSGITMLTGAQPFYSDDGVFMGTCSADMDLLDIRSVVQNIRVGETGRAFLISSKGNYVSFRDEIKDFDTRITEDADPELAALGQELMTNDRGVTQMKDGNTDQYVYYMAIPSVGWRLGISINTAEITAPTRSLVWMMMAVALLTLVAMTLAVTLLARHIRRIIHQVNAFSQQAAGGELDARIHLNVQDEFHSIADNLNIMMENMGRMSRAKSDFLSRMSHEIRTPMNAIVGMAQIAKNTADRKKTDECLEQIENSSKHLLGLINDILDYSKVEAGMMALDVALFSLTADMQSTVAMLAGRAVEKDVVLALHLEDIVHDGVHTDALRLNQVMLNLLTNAVKFTDGGGRVDVTVRELDHVSGQSTYFFAVRDTGIGISQEQMGRLFSPFEQADASISTRYGGTGLGLTISGRIVEMMGGQIVVESEPGKGSQFSFTLSLPAQTKVDPTQDDVSEEPLELSGKRALVVDDIDINREIVLALLEDTGLAMDTAEDGKQALDMFVASPIGHYDIILMDMQMPVMDGYAATREIRICGRPDAETVKIVAMTANALAEDVQRALSSGMDGHISKPLDMRVVNKTLRKQLL